MEQLHLQITAIREKRREIVQRRRQKLEELGAFDEVGQVIEEFLDEEAQELGAERGRLTRQLFDLISENRAHSAIHTELWVRNLEVFFVIALQFFFLLAEVEIMNKLNVVYFA